MNTSFHEQLFSMGNQSLKMTTGKCLSATHSHAQYWSVAAGCRNHATTNLNGELLYADETDGGGKGGSRGGHVSSWGADRIRHVEYSCALMTLAVSAAGCRPECQGYYGGRARFNTETYTHPNTYTHTHTHIKRERERVPSGAASGCPHLAWLVRPCKCGSSLSPSLLYSLSNEPNTRTEPSVVNKHDGESLDRETSDACWNDLC